MASSHQASRVPHICTPCYRIRLVGSDLAVKTASSLKAGKSPHSLSKSNNSDRFPSKSEYFFRTRVYRIERRFGVQRIQLQKGRYVYYRCSHGRGKCSLPYMREQDVSDRLGELLKPIYVRANDHDKRLKRSRRARHLIGGHDEKVRLTA